MHEHVEKGGRAGVGKENNQKLTNDTTCGILMRQRLVQLWIPSSHQMASVLFYSVGRETMSSSAQGSKLIIYNYIYSFNFQTVKPCAHRLAYSLLVMTPVVDKSKLKSEEISMRMRNCTTDYGYKERLPSDLYGQQSVSALRLLQGLRRHRRDQSRSENRQWLRH